MKEIANPTSRKRNNLRLAKTGSVALSFCLKRTNKQRKQWEGREQIRKN